MSRTLKLEKKVKDEWVMHGMYQDSSLSQMAQAIGDLYTRGFRIYESLRIVEVKRHCKSRIL